ncbi:MAG: hypothetical protein R3D63_17530 [Paracoccaceae bacterium]
MSRGQKQALILLADTIAAPLSLLLTTQLVYAAIWPQDQLERLAILFPAVAMLGALTSLAAGLPRIKLKTYASLAGEGIGLLRSRSGAAPCY